jgi:hypothetical protein
VKRVRSSRFLGAAALLTTTLVAQAASADASAWMFVGGGPMGHKMHEESLDWDGSLTFDIGVGSSPDGLFIVGGLFRVVPIFGSGADLVLSTRTATRGFQSGTFGVALDLGGYLRPWGEGSSGFAGGLVLGAPLGLQLAINTQIGTNAAFGVGAIAGVDLLRLTVYRQSLLDWWPNPSPAQQKTRDSARAW